MGSGFGVGQCWSRVRLQPDSARLDGGLGQRWGEGSPWKGATRQASHTQDGRQADMQTSAHPRHQSPWVKGSPDLPEIHLHSQRQNRPSKDHPPRKPWKNPWLTYDLGYFHPAESGARRARKTLRSALCTEGGGTPGVTGGAPVAHGAELWLWGQTPGGTSQSCGEQ